MTLPIACLWISRNLLDQDSAFADNIAANVVGLGLGMVARFYLFRQVIFSQKNYAPTAFAGTTTLPIPGNSMAVRGTHRGESGQPESDPGNGYPGTELTEQRTIGRASCRERVCEGV